jgi:deazaflavin-dependent oxidoreductase (nitroreductase family)
VAVLVPRPLLRVVWGVHGAVRRLSGARLGTTAPRGSRLGVLFLATRGRRTGAVRRNGLFYVEDGPNLAVVASNAGAEAAPAWWLNLQATPDAEVELPSGRRLVRARPATPDEQARLWPRLVAGYRSFEAYRRATNRDLPIVILEPRAEATTAPARR